MKFMERLKLWFNVKSEKMLDVSDTDKLKATISEKMKKSNELNAKYHEAVGKKESAKKEIDAVNKRMQLIKDTAAKLNVEVEADKANLIKLANEHESLEATKQTLEESYKICETVVDKLNQSKIKADTYITALKGQLKQVELKEGFSKQIDELSSLVDITKEFENGEELVKKVDVGFEAANSKLKEITESTSVDDIIRNTGVSAEDNLNSFLSKLDKK